MSSNTAAPTQFAELNARPHRRLNALTGEWVLVSPHRTQRPWQGQVEKRSEPAGLTYDPGCYLCPGNERAGGARNPKYDSTFVFTNDFAALQPDVPRLIVSDPNHLLHAEGESGTCKVICFSPRHDLTLSRMAVPDIANVVNVWAEQYKEIGSDPNVGYVQIFENRGEMMGCSNPHPHGQIWASRSIPNEPLKEQDQQQGYAHEHESCLLCDYLKLELANAERILIENEHFVALVPFWAVWPYETLVLPKRHVRDIAALDPAEHSALAEVLKRVTTRYDNLFQTSFPYSMGWHQAPTDGAPHTEWHLHAHFYPPLLRSATIRKFMVGFEMFGSPQRDITPELAANTLRGLSDVHYTERK